MTTGAPFTTGPVLPLAVVVLVSTLLVGQTETRRIRQYYVAAVELEWDYAPKGNRLNDNTKAEEQYIKRGRDRIGSIYSKVVFREYTDGTFTQQVERLSYMGILGPILRAETNDIIRVRFKNMVTSINRPFSMHPHGLTYTKSNEGAVYEDGTEGADTADDGIARGQTYDYVWTVNETFGPTPSDEACLCWTYHSHVNPSNDVNTGLVGMILTCKPGTLETSGPRKDQRKDMAAEFPLYLDINDENESWLTQRNLQRCLTPAWCRVLYATKDASFTDSNQMVHINGLAFGNLEGITVTLDTSEDAKPVAFYLVSAYRGLANMHITGHVFTVNQRSMDSILLTPATFVSASVRLTYPGTWLITSNIDNSVTAGQSAFFTVLNEPEPSSVAVGDPRPRAGAGTLPQFDPVSDRQAYVEDELVSAQNMDRLVQSDQAARPAEAAREYFMGIHHYDWDYGPSGRDLFNGGPLTDPDKVSARFFTRSDHTIGGVYRKTGFVQYTDATFTTRKNRSEVEEHMGFLGPVLFVEEGEVMDVHVKNSVDRPFSFCPRGLLFDRNNDGYVYRNPDSNQMQGLRVLPGDTVTYRFTAPLLTAKDPPCLIRLYHSAVDFVKDKNTGLFGVLLICKKGELGPNPVLPTDGFGSEALSWFHRHKHMFINFLTLDENASWQLQYNIDKYASDPDGVDIDAIAFINTNRLHAINGLMYGNLEGLNVCQGERVAWHMMGLGGASDLHGVNFHGTTFDVTGNHVSSKLLTPGDSFTMTSQPITPGRWSMVCRTNSHFLTGMLAMYNVAPCGDTGAPPPEGTVVRRFYLAAEEGNWDFIPKKRNPINGQNFTDDSEDGYLYLKKTDGFLGSTYKKVRYIEYTDDTFTTVKTRRPDQEHLGILGPVLKVQVGETLEVVFYNKASRPYSIYAQGLQYDKVYEGAFYGEELDAPRGEAVQPLEKFTYRYNVPPESGPGENDPNCISFVYFSSVNSVNDMSSGLVGSTVVCRKNTLAADLSRTDVDREFWLLFYVFDESYSWYYDENVRENGDGTTVEDNSDFVESNKMNAINGLVFGNVEGLVMDEGDIAVWYLMGLGSNADFHPVHTHGMTFTYDYAEPHRADVMNVYPSTTKTIRMLCDNPGTWLMHCHYADHVNGGMEVLYTVLPAGN